MFCRRLCAKAQTVLHTCNLLARWTSNSRRRASRVATWWVKWMNSRISHALILLRGAVRPNHNVLLVHAGGKFFW